MPKVLVIDDEAGVRTLLVTRFRHQDMVGSLHARLDGVELYRRDRAPTQYVFFPYNFKRVGLEVTGRTEWDFTRSNEHHSAHGFHIDGGLCAAALGD